MSDSKFKIEFIGFKDYTAFQYFVLIVGIVCATVMVSAVCYIVFGLVAVVFNFFYLFDMSILIRLIAAWVLVWYPAKWVQKHLKSQSGEKDNDTNK